MYMNSQKDKLPVLIEKVNEKYKASACYLTDCSVIADTFHDAIDLIIRLIEDQTWKKSEGGDKLQEPLNITPTQSNGFIHYVEVAKRYDTLPNIIYLYYPFNENLLRMIYEPYVWFSKTETFNDPYELPNVIEYDWTAAEFLNEVRFAYPHSRKKDGWGNQFKSSEDAFAYFQLNDTKTLEEIAKARISSIEDTFKKFKISCFSRCFDNILMWSHYANKHRGVVIGYYLSKITSSDEKIIASDVDYRHHKKKIRAGESAGKITDILRTEYATRKILTKHPLWSYEQEFRLLTIDDNFCGQYKIPKDSIKEVFFGVNMDSAVRKSLIAATKKLEIELFDMKMLDDYKIIKSSIDN
jgi:hypothetical protein